eukprot:Pgem_evm1s19813
MIYESGKLIGQILPWPEAENHFYKLTNKNIKEIPTKEIENIIQKMEQPNFCALHKKFDRSFLSYNVKNIYKKLQHPKSMHILWRIKIPKLEKFEHITFDELNETLQITQYSTTTIEENDFHAFMLIGSTI